MARQGRRCSRRLLVQALYQLQLASHPVEELLDQFISHPDFSGADREYFELLLNEVMENTDSLDADIAATGDIPGAQLDPVERAILWIAIAELRFQTDVPTKVVINEAVNLAKEFGAEGGYRYVNGVLDKLARQLRVSGK